MENQISIDQLRIVKLTDNKYRELLEKFETDTKELKDFLIEDSLNNYEISISTTYLCFYNPDNRLVAYITVLTDAIRIHGTQVGKTFTDKGVDYKTLPAIKIGRMCVDKRYLSRGIGTHLIYFVMRLLLEVNEKVGCRFIVLDAKPQTNAQRFYKKFGFEVLKQREKGTIPMFLDMIKYIKYYREGKQKLRPPFIDETNK